MSAAQPQGDNREDGQRESIWSVAAGFLKLYILLFGIFFVFGTGYLVYYEIAQLPTGNGHDIAAVVIKSVGSVAIGAAGVSFFATELVGGAMVLASYLKRKLLDEPQRAREQREARTEAELAEAQAELAEAQAELAEAQAERNHLRRALRSRRRRRMHRRARAENHISSNPNQD